MVLGCYSFGNIVIIYKEIFFKIILGRYDVVFKILEYI